LIQEVQDGFVINTAYDEVGNPISRQTSAGNSITTSHDLKNQAVSITINDQPPMQIERDAMGRTVKEQWGHDLERVVRYNQADQISAQCVLRNEAPLFATGYEYDRAGNLTQRKESGYGTDQYSYDPLGNLLRHTDPTGKVTAFLNDPAGEQTETETTWKRTGEYEGKGYTFDRAGNLTQRGDMTLRWDEKP